MTALAGIRVVEVASEAGALAGKLLADMGADVIVVEPPAGSPTRHHPPFAHDEPDPEASLAWWHHNTSKRGVTIDLDRPEGAALFRRLVATADVLLDAEPVGRLDALGLGFASLAADHEALIQASVTAFGQSSERAGDPVTDLTVLAGGGPVWSCGYSDHRLPPIRGGGFQGWNIACHYAVMAVLTAYLHRLGSGRGQFVDVSQHAAANVTTEMASYHWLIQQTTVRRQTGRHAMENPTMPTQLRCADGRYVNTAGLPRTPQQFRGLLDWLGDLGLRDELPEAIFLEAAADRDRIDVGLIGSDDEVTASFGAAREALALVASRVDAMTMFLGAQRVGIPVGVVYAPEEAFEDEHFVARGFQVEVDHDDLDRTVRYPGAPYRFEKTPWRISRRAPHLGEHDDEILAELGPPG